MQPLAQPSDLAIRYQQMDDNALLRLSSDTKSLLAVAQAALSMELRRRHLDSPEALRRFHEEEKKHIAQSEEPRLPKLGRILGALLDLMLSS